MKALAFLISFMLLFCNCEKERNISSPKIIWKKPYPAELSNYCCLSIHSRPGAPLLLSPDELLFFGRNNSTYKSTIFKVSLDGLNQLDIWHEEVGWSLEYASKYIESNKLYFDVRKESIYKVNLNGLITEKIIAAPSSRDGMQIVDSMAYIIRYTSGISVIQINLSTGAEKSVYTAEAYGSGVFAINPIPYVFKSEEGDHSLVVCENINDRLSLTRFNISKSEMVWQVRLNDFHDDYKPNTSEVVNNIIVVNSLTSVSVRHLADGNKIWSRYKNIKQNEEKPFFTDQLIIIPENKSILCFELLTGVQKWEIRDGTNGISWGSSILFKKVGDYLFINHNPVNILTGQMYWNSLDNWNEQEYLYLEKNPAVDLENKCLYYTGSHYIYKVELPE